MSFPVHLQTANPKASAPIVKPRQSSPYFSALNRGSTRTVRLRPINRRNQPKRERLKNWMSRIRALIQSLGMGLAIAAAAVVTVMTALGIGTLLQRRSSVAPADETSREQNAPKDQAVPATAAGSPPSAFALPDQATVKAPVSKVFGTRRARRQSSSPDQKQRLAALRREINERLKRPAPWAPPPKPPKPKPSGPQLTLPTEKTVPERSHFPGFTPPTSADIRHDRRKGHFMIPVHKTVEPIIQTDCNIKYQSEIGCHPAGMNMNYGHYSINWDAEKIARDILQNFFDGHDGTLEGVKFDIDYDAHTNTYKVKISGKSQFHYKYLEDMGAGTKAGDSSSAGGFGEGSKVVNAKLLALGVKEIIYKSANWKLSFSKGDESKHQDPERVYKDLEHVPNLAGSSMEFETGSQDLVDALLQASNYFDHPENPDFQKPTFQNKHWGFRYEGLRGKGNLYYASQRFGVVGYPDDVWEQGLGQLTIFGKQKCELYDPGRDRAALTAQSIESIVREYAKTMETDELLQAIYDLSDLWSPGHIAKELQIDERFVDQQAGVIVLQELVRTLARKRLPSTGEAPTVDFSKSHPKFVCLDEPTFDESNRVSDGYLKWLKSQGYTICHPVFASIGMKTVSQLYDEQKQHTPIQPTPAQKRKIQILKLAAENLLKTPEMGASAIIRHEDTAQPIYLFKANNERDMQDRAVEAITEPSNDPNRKVFKGAWFDVDSLNKDSFDDLLAYYLGVMSFQYGGNDSEAVNTVVLEWLKEFIGVSSGRYPEARQALEDLRALWDNPTEDRKHRLALAGGHSQ